MAVAKSKKKKRPSAKAEARASVRAAAFAKEQGKPIARKKRPRRKLKIGISCYAHFGGSGVVASELGLELAHRGHEVHLVASHLPFRLRSFESNIYFHESSPAYYPVFEDAPSNLALAAKMVEVAENYHLDLMHVHYAMPFATSAYLARQILMPKQLGVVTTLHGTDITVVGAEPAFFSVTRFSIQSSDRVTAVSRFLKERAEETFGITRPIEVIYNFVDPHIFAPKREGRLRLAGPGHEGADARLQLPCGQEHTGRHSDVRRGPQAGEVQARHGRRRARKGRGRAARPRAGRAPGRALPGQSGLYGGAVSAGRYLSSAELLREFRAGWPSSR